MKHIRLLSCILGAPATLSACDHVDEPVDVDTVEIQASTAPFTPDEIRLVEALEPGEQDLDRPYVHPFQGAMRGDGLIPMLDVKDSPEGKRYAVAEWGHGGEQDDDEVSRQGIVELTHYPTPASIRATKADVRAARQRGDAPKIGKALSQQIEDAADPSTVVQVSVSFRHQELPTFTERYWRAIAQGRVETDADVADVTAEVQAEIAEEIAGQLGPFLAVVEQAGGQIVYPCKNAHCATVEIELAKIEGLAERSEIARVDQPQGLSDATSWSDARDLGSVMQFDQYWDQGYDGENGGSTDITAAVIERGGFRYTHNTFLDSPSTSDRIRWSYECTSTSCATESWSASDYSQHATSSLSGVIGDLTDGQDANFTTTTSRERRSSAAKEGRAYVYEVNSSETESRVAYDNLVDRATKPWVVSYSIPWEGQQDCTGETTAEKDVDDELYENGVLMIAAAGNSGQSSSDCRVWSPGSAAGAFTVAGFGGNSSYTDECIHRDVGLKSNSSSGGCFSSTSASCLDEGKGRSIIDIAGSYRMRQRADKDGDQTYFTNSDGTSIAAPMVAGAAMAFIDMWKNEHSNFIDWNPGYLAAWMLQMGDRARNSGGTMGARFDHYFGAGRLQMRTINNEGMDGPWYWASGSTCVDDGETVEIPLNNGNPLSSSTDDLHAVIWWYDRNLENGDIDDIDLALDQTNGGGYWSSSDAYDNKERINAGNVGGRSLTLKIIGDDVTADNEGCGGNSMKVYYTVLAEDDARNDGNGPTWNAATCIGAEPW